MSYLEAIIFGIIQGITEFLPISSTAHIVITSHLLNFNFPGLTFEIFLHIASVLAVIIYFRKDLIEIIMGFFGFFKKRTEKNRVQFYFTLYLLVATVITGGLGVVLKDFVQDFMKTPVFMGITLSITGTFLIIIERFHKYGNRTEKEMTFLDSIIIGLGQTVAVMPGISRSGATLVTALWTGLNRETAVRYSFILVIPVILGSTVLGILESGAIAWAELGFGPLVAAFVATFVFSWIGIVWLIDFLKKSRLVYFAMYCFAAALMIILFLRDMNVGAI